MIHTAPRCLGCGDLVSSADLVFAPPCGSTAEHHECGSAVWHPLCLMEHRERLERVEAMHEHFHKMLDRLMAYVFDEAEDDDE